MPSRPDSTTTQAIRSGSSALLAGTDGGPNRSYGGDDVGASRALAERASGTRDRGSSSRLGAFKSARQRALVPAIEAELARRLEAEPGIEMDRGGRGTGRRTWNADGH